MKEVNRVEIKGKILSENARAGEGFFAKYLGRKGRYFGRYGPGEWVGLSP
jgi:hypothetical protein